MKTIGYIDLEDGNKILKIYRGFNLLEKRLNRIKQGLEDLRHTGNIAIYLINSKKWRLIKINKL